MKAGTLLWAITASLAAATPTFAADACDGPPSTNKLIVQVTGAKPVVGEVAVTLYPDKPSRFLASKGKIGRQRVTTAETTTACFWLAAPGYYAVAVYHDANADRNFNRNLIGLPTEGFGFSNDAPTPVGLPAFSAVRFKADGAETTIHIKLRYLR